MSFNRWGSIVDGVDQENSTETSISKIRSDGVDIYPDIPDTSVSRAEDDGSNSGDVAHGMTFKTTPSWDKFQARISSNNNTASDEEMVIALPNDDDSGIDEELYSIDVSSLGSNDVATFDDITLEADTKYFIFCRTPSGESRTRGYSTSVSFPYTSDDGDLEFTGGYYTGDGERTDTGYAISEIGNINL